MHVSLAGPKGAPCPLCKRNVTKRSLRANETFENIVGAADMLVEFVEAHRAQAPNPAPNAGIVGGNSVSAPGSAPVSPAPSRHSRRIKSGRGGGLRGPESRVELPEAGNDSRPTSSPPLIDDVDAVAPVAAPAINDEGAGQANDTAPPLATAGSATIGSLAPSGLSSTVPLESADLGGDDDTAAPNSAVTRIEETQLEDSGVAAVCFGLSIYFWSFSLQIFVFCMVLNP